MLTLDWLAAHDACAEGRDWFAAHYPDGVTPAMTEEFVDALLGHVQEWAEWLVYETPLWAEYRRQALPLWAEYRRQVLPRQRAPLLAECERQEADLLRHLLCQWLATPTEEDR